MDAEGVLRDVSPRSTRATSPVRNPKARRSLTGLVLDTDRTDDLDGERYVGSPTGFAPPGHE